MATRFVRWRHGNVEEEQEQEQRKEQILSSILAKNGYQKMVIFGPFWAIDPSKLCVMNNSCEVKCALFLNWSTLHTEAY